MTTPTYNPNVPEHFSDNLAETQEPLLINFQTLFDDFLKNHVSLDAGATAGNHSIIQLLERDNTQQTGAGELSVYTKKVDGQTDQVFLKYQGPSGAEFQFSNYQLYSIPSSSSQTAFFTFLPGGIIAYFGSYNLSSNTGQIALQPAICRNIISVDVIGGVNVSIKPVVNLRGTPQGRFGAVSIEYSSLSRATTGYYLILGNP